MASLTWAGYYDLYKPKIDAAGVSKEQFIKYGEQLGAPKSPETWSDFYKFQQDVHIGQDGARGGNPMIKYLFADESPEIQDLLQNTLGKGFYNVGGQAVPGDFSYKDFPEVQSQPGYNPAGQYATSETSQGYGLGMDFGDSGGSAGGQEVPQFTLPDEPMSGTFDSLTGQNGIDQGSLIAIATAKGIDPRSGWLYYLDGQKAYEEKFEALEAWLEDVWPEYQAGGVEVAPIGMPDQVAADLGMIPNSELEEYTSELQSITPPGFQIEATEQGRPIFKNKETGRLYTLTELANHGVYGNYIRAGLGLTIATESGWKMLGGGRWESPEGIEHTFKELVGILYDKPEIDYEGTLEQYFPDIKLAPEGMNPGKAIEMGMLPQEHLEGFIDQQLEISDWRIKRYNEVKELISYIFPDDELSAVFDRIDPDKSNDLEGFISDIQDIGRTEKTEQLLNLLFPTVSESDIAQIFGEVAVPSYEEWSKAEDWGWKTVFFNRLFQMGLDPKDKSREAYEEFKQKLNDMPVALRAAVGGGLGSMFKAVGIGMELSAAGVGTPDSEDKNGILSAILTGVAPWSQVGGSVAELAEPVNQFLVKNGVADTFFEGADALSILAVNHPGPIDERGPKMPFGDNVYWQDVYISAWSSAPYLSLMVPMFLGYAAGGPVAASMGMGTFGRYAISTLMGVAAATPPEAAMEAAFTYDEVIQNGGTIAEAQEASQKAFEMNLAALGITNTAQLAAFFLPGKGVTGAFAKGLVKFGRNPAGQIIFQGFSEGFEEYLQEAVIPALAKGEDIKFGDDEKVATFIGWMYGSGFGSASAVYNYFINKTVNNLPAPVKTEFDESVREKVADGAEDIDAKTETLDELTESNPDVVKQALEFAKQDMQIEQAEVLTKTTEQKTVESAVSETESTNIIVEKTVRDYWDSKLEKNTLRVGGQDTNIGAFLSERIENAGDILRETNQLLINDIGYINEKIRKIKNSLDYPADWSGALSVDELKTLPKIKSDIENIPATTELNIAIKQLLVSIIGRDRGQIESNLNKVDALIKPQSIAATAKQTPNQIKNKRLIDKKKETLKQAKKEAGVAEVEKPKTKETAPAKVLPEDNPVSQEEIAQAEQASKEAEAKVAKLVEQEGKITEEGEIRSLGAAAMLDMRSDVANALWEKAQGKGYYKTPTQIKEQLDQLSDTQVKKLYNRYVNEYILPPEVAEQERYEEYAKRTGMPKGYINAMEARSLEEQNMMAEAESWEAIKESPLDAAMVYYYNTADFEGMIRLLPKIGDLKLEALGKTVLQNIHELDALIVENQQQIDSLNTELAKSVLSKDVIKQHEDLVRILTRDNKNIEAMIKELRGGSKFSIDDAGKLGIALRRTRTGNIVPALRDSGFFVTQEFADAKNMENVGYGDGLMQDIDTLFNSIDGGELWRTSDVAKGVAQKYIKIPAYDAIRAGLVWQEVQNNEITVKLRDVNKINLNKEQWLSFAKLSELIETVDLQTPNKELLARKDVQEIIGKYETKEANEYLDGVKAVRALYDSIWTQQNMAREARGQDIIPYRKNYLPHVRKTNLFSNLVKGKKDLHKVMDRPGLEDFIEPNAPFTAHALVREEGMEWYQRETNVYTLMLDYIGAAKRDIFNTQIIQNIKVHAAVMETMGLESSARLIREWGSEVFAGTQNRWDKDLSDLPGGEAGLTGMRFVRRNISRAVFPLNFMWNLTIQPSSAAMTVSRGGIVNAIKGLDVFFDSAAKKQAKHTYTYIIKSHSAGQLVHQDLGDAIGRHTKVEKGLITKAEEAGSFLISAIENTLTQWSARVGYYYGKQIGLEGRALTEMSSHMAALTQSMYNRENQPGILRSKAVSSMFPFQTFTLQAMNFVRETTPVLSERTKTGAYKTWALDSPQGKSLFSRRVKMWLTMIAMMVAINMAVEKITGRKPWIGSSFLPFFSILQGVANPGNTWFAPLPLQYSMDFYKAFGDIVERDNWDKMRKWLIRYHAFGGTQGNRIIDGIIALARGEVTDVAGRHMFDVESDEWFKVISQGPYASQGGQDYLDNLRKNENFWQEWFGLLVPDRISIDGEISTAIDKLGEVDAEGKVFSFKEVVTLVKNMQVKVGDTRFSNSDNPIVAGYRESLTHSEELEKLLAKWREAGLESSEVSQKRNEWRRANPEADAYLALFNYYGVGKIQTREGYEIVKSLVDSYGISTTDLFTFMPPEQLANTHFQYEDNVARNPYYGSTKDARIFREHNPVYDAWKNFIGDWSVTRSDKADKVLEQMREGTWEWS